MGKLKLFLLLLILSSCIKQPEACISGEDTQYWIDGFTLTSCATDYEYKVWDYGINFGSEGDVASYFFPSRGKKIISLTAYSKGGSKMDVATKEVNLVIKVVDSVQYFGEVDGYCSGGGTTKVYALFDGQKSNETYSYANPYSFPLSFTFPNKVELTSRTSRIEFRNETNNCLLNYFDYSPYDVPISFTSPTNGVYWHLE